MQHNSHWTATAVLFMEIQHFHRHCIERNAIARIVLNEGHKLTCWIWWMWPQFFIQVFVLDTMWAVVNDLHSVWSWTSLCGTPDLATRSYDVTMIYSTHAIIIDAFVNKINCSRHGESLVRVSQATVRTCKDNSGSKVQSFCSRREQHVTLLLTVITKVFVECIIEST